jgi:hypothetical protein
VGDRAPALGVFDCLCGVLAQCGHSTPPGSAADDDVLVLEGASFVEIALNLYQPQRGTLLEQFKRKRTKS